MTEEERNEMLSEAKVFALANPVVLPLLSRRKANAHGKLIQSFKTGQTDNLSIVAEITVLTELENEMKQKAELYNTLEGSTRERKRK